MPKTFLEVFPLAVTPRHPLLPRLRETLAALEGLHQLPGIEPFGLRAEPMLDDEGKFVPSQPEYGVRVADDAETPCLTAVHEVAHALDYYAFGGVGWASERLGHVAGHREAWSRWLGTASGSGAVERLRDGAARGRLPTLRQYCAYLLEPKELFARCYAQYAAVRSSSPALLEELAAPQCLDPPSQWPDEEFATIAQNLDALLGAYGWR